MLALDERQEAFCHRYAEHRNGKRAAQEAGYNGCNKTLAVTANRLLKRANIKEKLRVLIGDIEEAQKNATQKAQEALNEEYKQKLMGPLERLAILAGMARDAEKGSDKLKAIELLCKLDGSFVQDGKNPNDTNLDDLRDRALAAFEKLHDLSS
jgi:phage terminase small subunit